MVRLGGRLLGFLLLGLFVCIPSCAPSDAGSQYDTMKIKDYRAQFDLGADGNLAATETLRVDFGDEHKHGLFRFFDTVDTSDTRARLMPEDFAATRDGASEQVDRHESTHGKQIFANDSGRFVTYQLGSPGRTFTGVHTYVLKYRIKGAIERGTTGQPSQFYWNLIPDGWGTPIEHSELTVNLPAQADRVQCAVGVGKTGGCTATGQGTRTLHVNTGWINQTTPVTVKTGLDIPTPKRDQAPWTYNWSKVLGPSWIALIVVGLGVLLAAVAGWLVARRTYEKPPAFPLTYEPPSDVGPGLAQYIATEEHKDEAFVASLLHAAERGAITMSSRNGGWIVASTGNRAAWESLDPITAATLEKLQVAERPFTAKRGDVASGTRLSQAKSEHDWKIELAAIHYFDDLRFGILSRIAVGLAIAAALVIAAADWFQISAIGMIPAAFAAMAAPVFYPGALTRRDSEGRELWSRIGGFRRVLATSESQQRFNFAANRDLFVQYVPWAVAFGVADEWTEKYRMQMRQEAPLPRNVMYQNQYQNMSYAGLTAVSLTNEFNSTISSAIGAYSATRSSGSSSSSGGGYSGGGFSGGGGGGGGGGGSW